ncbi:tRNA uracil 4-sulfurtransferase ThiI [Mechercharimyces sp. CAU 1602]|uniref:tRNA uracil 4-sulfurtransferase ThiI n=1 Tax=Mechercharimyces sp. CAU 1602 TaxID=2973933 RepID=UPI002161B2DA|nr:tRNA uracil 4-sulfurtransferase ThiI [Mechercharimyces sp. CAU 1602]MCS1350538.1 tRNA 4-thiouridine(8) synthase ThiI [Mechercharimyces sp. CAU 1602]
MVFDCILVRYGELALKGNNRREFENRLLRNIRQKLKAFYKVKVTKTQGRIFVELGGEEAEPVMEGLQDVFGIVGFSPAMRVPLEYDDICRAAVQIVENSTPRARTFKVIAKRGNKQFPIRSQELNRQVGGHLLQELNDLEVDVHQPELKVHVEVREEAAYVYGNDRPGLGGLPVGSSGRVMLLLSGGIDSPVAGYLALKRGAELHAVHFHSYPFTSERARKKVEDLAELLTRFGGKIHLHVVPFTEAQTAINQNCLEAYSITVMRRIMFRISERLAEKHGALALVTGESLGQVASQTLESMRTIGHVVQLPVLRPLIGMDKQEIMQLSKRMGTYETSILPYEDCCTVFLPKAPKTRPSLKDTERTESRLDVEALVTAAVEGTETMVLTPASGESEFSFF